MTAHSPVKKTAVSGSIDPRWPKNRIVRWLESGAALAIVGLWLPDWVGAYAATGSVWLLAALPPFPPLLTYIGAGALFVACYQGVKGMGAHFRGVVMSGAAALLFAAGSIIAQLAGSAVFSLALTGFAAVSATGALWFTIGKVAEITQETRTQRTWMAIPVLTGLTAVVYLGGLGFVSAGSPGGYVLVRAGIALLTVTFVVCRYGVHCYKTQMTIGAGFVNDPDDQYWARAN